jgi:pyruvate dehydrogenase E1 component beta subunit
VSTAELTYLAALREGMRQEMARDPEVIVLGEDVAGGAGRGDDGTSADAWGGPFGKTRGLIGEFGEHRVRDTPLSETAFMGMAVGAATVGMRPIVDLMFSDFIGVCFDQLLNQAAKLRYMTGGAVRVPITISTGSGGGIGAGGQHSGSLYAIFAHVAGLKCVAPATPADAKGLMAAAIRDDDPVVVFGHKRLFGVTGPVPTGEHVVPIGQANVVRDGDDVTVVGISATVGLALEAAAGLADEGISCEVIDLRSISPIDLPTIVASVERTRRLVVVDEATPRCGLAADIAASVTGACFARLEAAPVLVTAANTPIPFSPPLEQATLPSVADVAVAVRNAVGAASRTAGHR